MDGWKTAYTGQKHTHLIRILKVLRGTGVGERRFTERREKPYRSSWGEGVFYILLTNGDEFVEKWEDKGKVFLDFSRVGNCGAVTIWGHGWWKGLFRKVCLCGFFSVPSPSLAVRMFPPQPPPSPSRRGKSVGHHAGGFCPAFIRQGEGRASSCVCFLSMPSAQNSPYPEWRILGVAQAAALRYGCADVFVNLCCWSEKTEALSSFGARTSSTSLDSALHQDDL